MRWSVRNLWTLHWIVGENINAKDRSIEPILTMHEDG